MSPASLSDPRASVRYATEGIALGIGAALLALALAFLAPPAFAQKDKAGSDRATIAVMTEEGDTLPVVHEVIITRDGISIDARSGNVVGRIEDYSGGDQIRVEIDVVGDDPIIPTSGSIKCIEPPLPREQPVSLQ